MRTDTGRNKRGAWLLASAVATGAFAQQATNESTVPEPVTTTNTAPGITVISSRTNDVSDQELVRLIKKRLETDRWVPSYKVRIGALNGDVTLSGKVDNLLTKERAAQVAAALPGVRSVKDEVVVSTPPRQDYEIKTDVPLILRTNSLIDTDKIQSQVEAGIVTLSGVVDSDFKKLVAGSLVKGVPGVSAVENKLQVAYSTSRSDQEIVSEVMNRLQWDPYLGNPQISVQSKDGKVVLDGFVENEKAREQAYKSAWVMGTTAVDASHLRVAENMRTAFLPPNAPDGSKDEVAPVPEVPVTRVETIPAEVSETNAVSVQAGIGAPPVQNTVQPVMQDTNAVAVEISPADTNAAGGGFIEPGNVEGVGAGQSGLPAQPVGPAVVSVQNILASANPTSMAGQRVIIRSAKLISVVNDQLVFIGSDVARLALPVRLEQPVGNKLQPGQTVQVSGTITATPSQLNWTDVDAENASIVQRSPVFVSGAVLRPQAGRAR